MGKKKKRKPTKEQTKKTFEMHPYLHTDTRHDQVRGQKKKSNNPSIILPGVHAPWRNKASTT